MVHHSGNISSGPLLNVNDQYISIAKGESEAFIFLGIGGEFSNHMILEAKKNMYLTRPLKRGEYYANITCDFCKKVILFGLIYNTKVTVSADVLKISDASLNDFSESSTNKVNRPEIEPGENKAKQNSDERDSKNGLVLHPGDSVYYAYNANKYVLYKVSSIDKENVMLDASLPSEKNRLVSLNNRFFLKNFTYSKRKNGDKVKVELPDVNNSYSIVTGIVLGVCDTDVLIETPSGQYVIPENKLD